MLSTSTIYSFDIFDTCLVRACGTPDNFFGILSRQVFLKNVADSDRQCFIIARKKAEINATTKSSRATIFDIYDNFEFYHPLLLDKKTILNKELELESTVILSIQETKKTIDGLRENNQRIVFISDMYLPSSFIKPILLKYGIARKEDSVFISCEIGKTKYNGHLFEHIHETEGIQYNHWIHYGDNPISDIEMPKKLGIRARHLHFPYDNYSNKYLKNENRISFNYKNLLIGITRALSLSLNRSNRTNLILDIIAPLYCSFVYHVMSLAQKQGINHLFFCARDTNQMYKIAKSMSFLFPEIELHYLIISRQALYETPQDIVIQYLIQEHLASTKNNTAIVDVTSSGKTLDYINKLLIKYYYKPIRCFLLLKCEDTSLCSTNDYLCDYIINQYLLSNNKKNNYFLQSKSVFIIEGLFSGNPQNRVIGYHYSDNTITPIFSEKRDDGDIIHSDLKTIEQEYENLLLQYCKYWLNFGLFNYSDEILNEIAIPKLFDFFYIPEKKHLEGLSEYKMHWNDKDIIIIKKEQLFTLIKTRGKDTIWDRGTVLFSLPDNVSKWFIRKRILKQ